MKRTNAHSLRFPLIIWACIVLLWVVYRKLETYPELIEELVFKPLVFLGPVAFWLLLQGKLRTRELGLVSINAKKFLGWGVGLGAFLALENLLIRTIYWKDPIRLEFGIIPIGLTIFISLATAFSEEVLYRGFLLKRMLRVLKNVWAVALNALLFMIGHVGLAWSRSNYRGQDLVIYLSFILISGVVNAFIYERTRSVYASVAAHALWNFSSMLFIGLV